MNMSPCSMEQLLGIAEKAVERLARTPAADLDEEVKHRLWPFLVELLRTLQNQNEQDDGDEDDGAQGAVPLEAVLRVAVIVGTLMEIAKPHIPAELAVSLPTDAEFAIETLLDYVSESERREFEQHMLKDEEYRRWREANAGATAPGGAQPGEQAALATPEAHS